jgi:DME family drug/metabolite transporter
MANSFWRTVFFLVVISLYLLITYKKKVLKSFYDAGISGFLGGFVSIIWFLWICLFNVQYHSCQC